MTTNENKPVQECSLADLERNVNDLIASMRASKLLGEDTELDLIKSDFSGYEWVKTGVKVIPADPTSKYYFVFNGTDWVEVPFAPQQSVDKVKRVDMLILGAMIGAIIGAVIGMACLL